MLPEKEKKFYTAEANPLKSIAFAIFSISASDSDNGHSSKEQLIEMITFSRLETKM
jgi:hypothetical protein